jgi:glutathione S-transferase
MSDETLTLLRTFKAPRERVFDAFTQKEAIQAWFGPEGCNAPSVALDPKPGGKYRIEIHSPEGTVYVVTGTFREVQRPEKLVFTWAWLQGTGVGPETLVTLSFAEKGGATELMLVHSGFATATDRDNHNRGWSSSLECLTSMLAGKSQPLDPVPTILGDPRSSYTRSARMALIEKGIAHRLDPQPPGSDAVNAIHPFGKIPAFRCGKLELFESSAIMRYVDEVFPGPRLMPEDPVERAKAEQWVSSVHCYLYNSMIVRYVLEYVFPKGPDGKPDQTTIAGALENARKHLAILDRAYGSGSYLVGSQPTIADLLIAPIVFYVGRMPGGKELLEPFGAVRRGQDAMAERESFRATLPPTN